MKYIQFNIFYSFSYTFFLVKTYFLRRKSIENIELNLFHQDFPLIKKLMTLFNIKFLCRFVSSHLFFDKFCANHRIRKNQKQDQNKNRVSVGVCVLKNSVTFQTINQSDSIIFRKFIKKQIPGHESTQRIAVKKCAMFFY